MIDKNWSRKAVVYHIYPLSFNDSNNDGMGDLEGIIQKLDYLNDGSENSLGVNTVWLSPIYRSPMADFGYDISDYYDIDPIFGDLASFDKLVSEAHKRGIRMIMDFVPNHTSNQHPWFLESRASRTGSKRDWYIWRDPKPDGSPPNNWLSVFGGPAWTLDDKTGQYYHHSFLPEQPDLNWRNPEVKEEMQKVLHFWLHRKVDGFRTDAVYHLVKDGQFRDDPPNPDYDPGKMEPYSSVLHKYSQGRSETLDNLKSFCEVLGLHPDKFIISEAYIDLPELAKMYRACDNNLHAPINFNLMTIPLMAGEFRNFIDKFDSSLPPEKWPNYVLGNHDRPRVATRLGQDRARLAAMIMLTLRGMPFVYYGDELGMENVDIPEEKMLDPWGKRVPGFGLGRDGERTPMQWDGSKNAGFSRSKPWLPTASNYKVRNIETEMKDPRSMLNLFRRLIHYRKKSPALLEGSYHSIDVAGEVFAYVRQCPAEKLLVVANFSATEQNLSLRSETAQVICNTFMDAEYGKEVDTGKLVLRPYEGYVLSFA
ncbi:MAG: alpha-glucosidase C-terminal domain-containing protein [Candidatus Doudnabacteria bacterium]|nr:alpha-glucosidase C-terminal domain-containing protein [Candidatus Doudnabacteria bacterium]